MVNLFAHGNRIRNLLICSLILTACTMLLPWFSLNTDMHSFYGHRELVSLILPLFYAFAYFMWEDRNLMKSVLMQLDLILISGIIIYAFYHWSIDDNIVNEYNFHLSREAALPGYWLAVALSFMNIILYQVYLVSEVIRKRKAGISCRNHKIQA